jgi:hypothetical protein
VPEKTRIFNFEGFYKFEAIKVLGDEWILRKESTFTVFLESLLTTLVFNVTFLYALHLHTLVGLKT